MEAREFVGDKAIGAYYSMKSCLEKLNYMRSKLGEVDKRDFTEEDVETLADVYHTIADMFQQAEGIMQAMVQFF